MPSLIERAFRAWRRRHWRAGPEAGRFTGLEPFCVVTGASEGIGRALALELAREGRAMLLVARGLPGLEAVAAEIRAAGGKAMTLSADLSEPAGPAAVEQALSAAGGYADILVNDAGIGLGGPFVEQGHDELLRLCDLNMRGLTDLMRRCLPGMLARGEGGILNVASIAGLVPGPHQAAYYASKAYVISLTKAVAFETRGQGVRISVLAPGPVATKFHARMGAENSYYLSLTTVMSPEQVARVGVRWFRVGRVLIVPGILHIFNAMALKLLPHALMVPVVGWLLARRQTGKRHA